MYLFKFDKKRIIVAFLKFMFSEKEINAKFKEKSENSLAVSYFKKYILFQNIITQM